MIYKVNPKPSISSSYSHSIHRVMSTLHYIKPCKNCKLLYKSEPKLLKTNTCRIRTRIYILILKIMKCKIKLRFLVHNPKNITSKHFYSPIFGSYNKKHTQSVYPTLRLSYLCLGDLNYKKKKKKPNRPSSKQIGRQKVDLTRAEKEFTWD